MECYPFAENVKIKFIYFWAILFYVEIYKIYDDFLKIYGMYNILVCLITICF